MIDTVSEALAPLTLRPGERVLVSGQGVSADRMSEAIARITGVIPLRTAGGEDLAAPGTSEVDALVETTGDPAVGASLVARVRREGRVLLLVPSGSQVRAFDFYASVHRTSIALFVRRDRTGE